MIFGCSIGQQSNPWCSSQNEPLGTGLWGQNGCFMPRLREHGISGAGSVRWYNDSTVSEGSEKDARLDRRVSGIHRFH